MLICEKIFEKDFTDITMKKAYLKCCKWYAGHVISKNNSNNILHHIKKVNTNNVKESAQIRLTLYIFADESEVREKHCEICQEVSGAFYMSSNKHLCDSCKMKPYCRRLENKVDSLKKAMKGVIELE